jgi:hypothetical protein
MLLRQCFETNTDFVEVIDFAQDRLKRHGGTPSLNEKPKVVGLQMDWLRSEDLKEEKVVTTPVITLTRQERGALILVTLTCDRHVTLWGSGRNETRKRPAKNDPCRPRHGNRESQSD